MKKKQRPLTPKQRKFIAFYCGNGIEAARKAGYQGNDATLGAVAYENLRKPQVAKAIKARGDIDIEPLIATRTNRQKFWAKVMNNAKTSMRDRLKASELLGKSEADFIDVQKQAGPIVEKVIIVSEAEVEAALKKFNDEY